MRKVFLLAIAVLLVSMLVLTLNLSAKAETYFNDDSNGYKSSNWRMDRGTWFESGANMLHPLGIQLQS
jgi:hypothetical protein